MPDTPLILRAATIADLDSIMAIERSPRYFARVGQSSRPEHEAMLAGPRHAYFVGDRNGVEAFVILRDFDEPHGNVYLKRIAARPGRRAGGPLLSLVLDRAFAHPRVHRVHLDCFDDNFPPRLSTPSSASPATVSCAKPISRPTGAVAIWS